MRVYEVAKELDVSAEALVHLLREMDIPVRSHMTLLGEEHVSRLRTVMERERRLGHSSARLTLRIRSPATRPKELSSPRLR